LQQPAAGANTVRLCMQKKNQLTKPGSGTRKNPASAAMPFHGHINQYICDI